MDMPHFCFVGQGCFQNDRARVPIEFALKGFSLFEAAQQRDVGSFLVIFFTMANYVML